MIDRASSDTRRLFIAVMLPADVQETLAALIGLLDAHRSILRPTRPAALHLTLRFLGEMTEAQEQSAAEACAAATAGFAPFPLVVGGFGAFPNNRRPRVIWLGVLAGAAPLIALQRRVDDELLRRHVVSGREDFKPHLTLARVRQDTAPTARAALGNALSALPGGEQARCSADAVSLVHSSLSPHGSQYTILGTWPRPKDTSVLFTTEARRHGEGME